MPVKSFLFLLMLLLSAPVAAQQQVYHFKELQKLLPEGEYGSYKRSKPTGETSSMMGFATSWAQVVYRLDTDTARSTISVKITDMVSIPSYMSNTVDMDRETATGFERTVVYKGIRLLETYDSSSETGKLQMPVANRFLVEVTGSGLRDVVPLYDLLDRVPLVDLERLGQSAGSK